VTLVDATIALLETRDHLGWA